MSKHTLKSLDWKSLLNKHSDEEYDSDETLFEEELGACQKERNGFQDDVNGASTVEPQCESKNMHINAPKETVLQGEIRNICGHSDYLENIKANPNVQGLSENISGSINKMCNENFVRTFGLNDELSKVQEKEDNCTDSSESTFGFTDLFLNQTKVKDKCIESNEIGISEHLKIPTDPYNYSNCYDSSESTFGFTEMAVHKSNERWPEEQKLVFNEIISDSDKQLLKEPHLLTEKHCGKQLPHCSSSNRPTTSQHLTELHTANSLQNIGTNVVNFDNRTLNEDKTDYFTNPCIEKQQYSDSSALQSVNCFLGISTESLANILENDFIEDTFEDVNISRRSTCSPPLTLIEKHPKNYIKSDKNLPKKKTHNKRVISKKILPARACASKYGSQSKRHSESETSNSSLTPWKSDTKTRATIDTSDILLPHEDSDEHTKVKKAKWIGKKSKRNTKNKMLNAAPGKKLEKNLKGSLSQNLKKVEETLYQIEQKAYKWVNGEDHSVTRENAFEMLQETQSIAKILTSLQDPARNKHKFNEVKSKLHERAKKLALAIDVAISECDQRFRDECLDKLLVKKSIANCEENREDEGGNNKNHYKPILKYSNSEDSSKKSLPSGKHISFSDDVEFRYLSDNSSGCSGQTSSQPSTSSEVGLHCNDLKAHGFGKTTQNSLHNLGLHSFSYNESSNINSSFLNDTENSHHVDNFSSKSPEKLNDKLESKNLQVQESEVVSDSPEKSELTNAQMSPYGYSFIKISDIMPGFQNLDKNVKADVERAMSGVKECFEKHSENLSENSSEDSSSFGFSEDQAQPSQCFWKDISIMDIKYIRIKSPEEFIPKEEDNDKWLEDFDKW